MNRNLSNTKSFKSSLNAFSVITFFVVLMIVGIASIFLLPIQLEPSSNSSNIHLTFSWSKASAIALEQQVTVKIEDVLATVNGLSNISSNSSDENGLIQANIDRNINKNQIKYEIGTLIRQLYPRLPNGVSYPQITTDDNNNSENRGILTYSISGDGNSSDIQRYVETVVRPRLALIKGVYQINLYVASVFSIALSNSFFKSSVAS